MLDEDSINVVAGILGKQPEILAGWLFGSQASGRATADSDVDIAVLCRNALSLKERLALCAELESALKVERVDLVPLDSANPILAFEAIRGRPVFDRAPHERAAFVSLVSRVYEDVMSNLERNLSYRQSVFGT